MTPAGPPRRVSGGAALLPLAAELVELAHTVVLDALGPDPRIAAVDPLHTGHEHAVLAVHLDGAPHHLVLKVVHAPASPALDLTRTAAVLRLTRSAGAPAPAVLAAGTWHDPQRWQYLLTERVEGRQWRMVRPLLDTDQLAAAHRDIATALLAVQSVRFPAFGELGPSGAPVGVDLMPALRRRAELRIVDDDRRTLFLDLLERDAELFTGTYDSTLCHDDLHHANVLFEAVDGEWRLSGLLDWDKAWAGPAESDVARMAFWDDMTGPGFWSAYRAVVPEIDGADQRALVYQLLWCLEYPARSARHRADIAAVCRRLRLRLPAGLDG